MQSQQSQYQKYGLDLSKYHLDVDFDKPLSKQTTKNDDNKEVTWLSTCTTKCWRPSSPIICTTWRL